MFIRILSERKGGGCLAPARGAELGWGGGPQRAGVPPGGCRSQTPCCCGSALGKAAFLSQPRREGEREGCCQAEGGEALVQPSAAEEPERRGCSKNMGDGGRFCSRCLESWQGADGARWPWHCVGSQPRCLRLVVPELGTAASAAWEVILGCRFYPGWRGCLSRESFS